LKRIQKPTIKAVELDKEKKEVTAGFLHFFTSEKPTDRIASLKSDSSSTLSCTSSVSKRKRKL
jgi:hypothetical protein